MGRLRKFFRLPPSDRVLFLKTFLLLCWTRLTLNAFSLRKFKRLLRFDASAAGLAPGTGKNLRASRVPWAVHAASRYVPGATCLLQALVGQRLLKEQGMPARLRIGVAKDPNCCFQAHAWLEVGTEIVIGRADSQRYVPLA